MLKNLILVLNCGSSSVKFAVLNPINKKKYLFGLVERLYISRSMITWNTKEIRNQLVIGDNLSHEKAFHFIINKIFNCEKSLFSRILAVGHRVVHGGMSLKESVIINDFVIQEIKKNIIFSPLHNPINLLGIEASLKYFPHLSKKNVAVLDTAFYHTLPESSYLYAIPYNLYSKYGIRRYGAHGISHFYVSQQASNILNIQFQGLNVISCHLGSGSSVTVIKNGKCMDTSMGLTPLEGLVMGTRSGDIDPAIIFFMNKEIGMSLIDIEDILINQSGILGLTDGITSDFRYIENNYDTDTISQRAVNIFCHRLAKYISAYTSLLDGRLDAIIFTGGIGENSTLVREIIISRLSIFGMKINNELNRSTRFGKSGFINKRNTIPILVIPTNEELIIAQETIKLFN
ncbi:acetate kinase [Buchnera aphidicola]|uniref:acetate kinase n=1 Tax=Buchnera aphidicola TaxID=9 RepID=UPI00346469DD